MFSWIDLNFFLRLGHCGLGMLLGVWLWGVTPASAAAAEATPTPVDPGELLEVGPVDEGLFSKEAAPSATPDPDMLPTAEPDPVRAPTTPISSSPAYPVVTPTPETSADQAPAARAAAYPLSPYYVSAYLPPPDYTEVDLGLLLSGAPGVDVALNWGAWEEMMLGAKMTVQGSSYTTALGLRYALRRELSSETKPAIAALLGWRIVNHRTNDDARENIFRGNRIRVGTVFSKQLGSLARSLNANASLEGFLNYLTLHAEVLMEYQTGRRTRLEDELSRLEFGTRAEMELVLDPEQLRLILVFDSLPDWLDKENHYLGVRYMADVDFALDCLVGLIGEDMSVLASLAWGF